MGCELVANGSYITDDTTRDERLHKDHGANGTRIKIDKQQSRFRRAYNLVGYTPNRCG